MAAVPKSIRVLIVDDNPILCAGLERWLAREPGITWVACQTDWHRAVDDAARREPNIILLDIDLPHKSGIDLIAPLKAASRGVKVVMFSGLAPRAYIEKSLDAGASGYMVKDQEARVIAELIRRAASGEVVLCPAAAAALMGSAEPS
jgi:two-component system response regulator DesR